MRVTFPVVRLTPEAFLALPHMTPFEGWKTKTKVWREMFLGQWVVGYHQGMDRMPQWKRPVIVVSG